MRVMIEAVARELKTTAKGTVYTSLKLNNGQWINMAGDHLNLRGPIYITEPKLFGKQLWAQLEKSSPSDETDISKDEIKNEKRETPAPETGEKPKTLKELFAMIEVLHSKSKTLEPANPEARAILTGAMVTAWLDGKFTEK